MAFRQSKVAPFIVIILMIVIGFLIVQITALCSTRLDRFALTDRAGAGGHCRLSAVCLFGEAHVVYSCRLFCVVWDQLAIR